MGAGQRPAWLVPTAAGGGLRGLLALVGYAFLGTGSGADSAGVAIFASAFVMTFVLVFAVISTLMGGLSLALALCLLNASHSTFADFLTHFKSGLAYYAILWGVFGGALLLGILIGVLFSPELGGLLVGVGGLAVLILQYRLLMDWYDWDEATVRLVFFVMTVIQGLAGFAISGVIGFLAA